MQAAVAQVDLFITKTFQLLQAEQCLLWLERAEQQVHLTVVPLEATELTVLLEL
jgi:hypothetical protein